MCVRRSSCLSCSSFAQFHPLSFSLTHSLSHPLTHSLTLTSIFHLQLLDKDDIQDQDGASMDSDSERKGKAVVIKTSTRQVCCASYFTSILVFEKKKRKNLCELCCIKKEGRGNKRLCLSWRQAHLTFSASLPRPTVQTVFLPNAGLIPPAGLKPGDLIVRSL